MSKGRDRPGKEKRKPKADKKKDKAPMTVSQAMPKPGTPAGKK